jgi:hypothetical protein
MIKAYAENQTTHKKFKLWLNNGNEFISNQFNIFVQKMELHVNSPSLICLNKMV